MAICAERGTQIRPLVCRIMKAIWALVILSAAIIRSPSFSRVAESRMITNWPDSAENALACDKGHLGGRGLLFTEC